MCNLIVSFPSFQILSLFAPWLHWRDTISFINSHFINFLIKVYPDSQVLSEIPSYPEIFLHKRFYSILFCPKSHLFLCQINKLGYFIFSKRKKGTMTNVCVSSGTWKFLVFKWWTSNKFQINNKQSKFLVMRLPKLIILEFLQKHPCWRYFSS